MGIMEPDGELRAKVVPNTAAKTLHAELDGNVAPGTNGLGKPGRETSDLSAAIGHGRIPGLVVTRSQGWGLAEWDHRDNVIPPIRLETSATNTSDPDKDDPTDYDLINDEFAMNKGRPDNVVG